jgi:hypothetical protein
VTKRRSRPPAKASSRKAEETPTTSGKGLRRQWADLSLDKKLSIVVVPVVLTLVGLFVPRFLDDGAPPRKEELAVIGKPVVLNDKKRSFGNAAELQVLVRNTGTVPALIHSAEFRISRFESAEVCVVPQGELDVSGTYDVVLPAGADAAGKVVVANLAQRVPAGEPDRFSVNIRVADDDPVYGVSRMYVLDVLLRHDDAKQPLNVGQIIVALPFPDGVHFAVSEVAFIHRFLPDPECPTRNLTRLQTLLSLPATRAADLDRFLVNALERKESEATLATPSHTARDRASAAASRMLNMIREAAFKTACDSLTYAGHGAFEGAIDRRRGGRSDSCRTYLGSLAAGVPPPAAGPVKITETHRRWFKLAAARPAGGRSNLVLIVEALPVDLVATGKARRVEWLVTNIYDAADGPPDRVRDPVCSPDPC